MPRRRAKLTERTLVLILLGILAGGLGGVAIGVMTGHTPRSAAQ